MSKACSPIPVVNIDKLGVGNDNDPQKIDYEKVGKDVAAAFEKIGFVFLENHGIPQSLIEEVHEASIKFFQLPISKKERYSKKGTDSVQHGYVSINREKLGDNEAPSEIRESYDVKLLDGMFPKEACAELQPKVDQLCRYSLLLSFRLLQALETSLNLKTGTLMDKHLEDLELGGSLMRLLYYPPISSSVEKGTVRCGTHSDYGTFTLLFQDTMGGLEVLDRSGVWQSATPIPGTILVNVGDLLQIWTSDKFVATKHRVLVPEKEVRKRCSRSSIALFFHPNDDVMVRPLDGSLKYEPINAKQHVINRYSSTYKF